MRIIFSPKWIRIVSCPIDSLLVLRILPLRRVLCRPCAGVARHSSAPKAYARGHKIPLPRSWRTRASAIHDLTVRPHFSPERLHLHAQHRWQIAHNCLPAIASIGGAVHLAAGGTEVDSAFVQRIYSHRIAQDIHVAIFLRKAFGEGLPFVASGLTAE